MVTCSVFIKDGLPGINFMTGRQLGPRDVVHEDRNAGSWKDGGHASRGVCF